MIPLFAIYPPNTETFISEDICTCKFTAALTAIASQDTKNPRPKIDEWIKSYGIYTQWTTYRVISKYK